MILPEGNSKKYIKVVIGIYVLFSIVSPVITKFTGKNIELSDILDIDEYIEETQETSKMQNTLQYDNQSNILNIYSQEIKNDMSAKINEKGYIVNSIDIDVASDESYSIISLNINVTKENEKSKTNKAENNTNNNVEKIKPINDIEINVKENINSDGNLKSNEKNTLDNLTDSEKEELKEYLSSVYNIKEDNIIVN